MFKIECQVRITSLFNDLPSLSFQEVLFDAQQQFLFLPSRAIEQLDLLPESPRQCLIDGVRKTLKRYAAVRLTINDRFCSTDVLELPDIETPVLGTIPLQLLDFVVDYEECCMIGNPEHGGEEQHDLLLQII